MEKNSIYFNLKSSNFNSFVCYKGIKKYKDDILADIDKISKSFLEIGIDKNSVVNIFLDLSFELINSIYAFSKIGINSNLLDNSMGLDNIKKLIKSGNYLIIDSKYYNTYSSFIDEADYDKIIVIGKNIKCDDITIDWDSFISLYQYYNKPINYYQNFNIHYYHNEVLFDIDDKDIINNCFDFKIQNKDVLLCGNYYELGSIIQYSLLNNNNLIISNDYYIDIKQYKPSCVFINKKDCFELIKNTNDLSFVNKFYVLSEINDIHEEEIIRENLKSKYVSYYSYNNKIISVNVDNIINSVGRVLDNKIMSINDVLTDKKVNNNVIGNICIKVNNKYTSTNYVGYLDDDGNLYIIDALEEEIIRVKMRKTGFASIDMPWTKYYPEESKNDKVLEYTLYQNLRELNKENYLEIALEYLGESIKYYELFNNIEKCAKSLKALGIKKGDYVTFCMPNLPEFVYLFYGVSKIGAIACLIEPRTTAIRIKDYLDKSCSKYMFIVDLCKNNIDKIANDCNLKTIVSISPVESVKDKKTKSIYNLTHKKYKYSGKYISYKDFITLGESISDFKENDYEKHSTATVVYTSGTTGKPKGACLTNETYNGQNMQLKYSGICPHVGEVFLGNIPFFSAYGSSSGMHNALSSGVTIKLVPKYKPKDFPKLLKKYRPTHVMGVPRFYEILADSNLFEKESLNFLRNPVSGGDKMTPNREYKVNEYLLKNDSVKLKKGLGMSEFGGGFITTVNDMVNKVGSVGIPHVGNNVKIIDPDTKLEITYGREHNVGELYVTGPSQMKGYLNNEVETNCFYEIDVNGVKWARTGDLVYMDEDGVVFFVDRLKNVIMRPDGHTVPLLPIENAIDKSDYVESCAVVGANLDSKRTGKLPMAFIVLKNNLQQNIDTIHNEIKSLVEESVPEREQAKWYRYVDKLPYNLAGKVDLKKLEELGNEDKNKNLQFVNMQNNK